MEYPPTDNDVMQLAWQRYEEAEAAHHRAASAYLAAGDNYHEAMLNREAEAFPVRAASDLLAARDNYHGSIQNLCRARDAFNEARARCEADSESSPAKQ